jgi:serine protease AprX
VNRHDADRKELVKRARTAARDRLGSALEKKATDAFCVALVAAEPVVIGGAGRGRAGFGARLESLRLEEMAMGRGPSPRIGLAPTVAAVVEFKPPSRRELTKRIKEKVERVAEGAGAENALTPTMRQAGIEATRDEFYRSIGAIRDQIERSTAMLRPGREGVGVTTGPVQACWLNHTVRAESDATVLGDVASDPAVAQIDVPRQLHAEAVAPNVTLEAAAAVRAEQPLSGKGITVGVIDSEVAGGHPALAGRVIHRRNYTPEPFNTPDGHGTAVAGFVGADSSVFRGVAPEVTIYNYKVLATVSALNTDDFGGALAIQHALEDGIRVVNCSWRAGPNGDGTSREARACNTAWRLGLTIVKSAGNEGPAAQSLTTPADAEGVIAVGATDAAGGVIADYSSRGPTTDGRHRPHLVAPGGTFESGLTGLTVGGGVDNVGAGTSFAAPHITGLLALLLEGQPNLTPDQQRERLLAACRKLAGARVDDQGRGLIDPAALLT